MNIHPKDIIATPAASRSANKDWLRALQKTASIDADARRTLPVRFAEVAAARPNEIAVIDEEKTLTFAEFSAVADRCAHAARAAGLRKGDVVALMMRNCAEYPAIWLGLSRIGVVVALLNASLPAPALAHCLASVKARELITEEHFREICETALEGLNDPPRLRIHASDAFEDRADASAETPPDAPVTVADHALYIFTSGTTGMPKAAIVTHRRLLYWSLWFAGLADMTPADRMYDCLPMSHSVGGVVAVFAPLLSGASVVVRKKFSATQFWDDVAATRCTLFQYIGELCRYLAQSPASEAQSRHSLRLAIGNGLRANVWEEFQRRFALPRIIEFYAATESNFSLYNVEGELGAIGRIPAFLAARQPLALVRFDEETGAPARGADGRCVKVGVDEVGEAIAKISGAESAGAFEGYLSRADSEKKILRDVFEPGDAFMRSGDLMRKDARGFYFFADRIGDSFRWKGENVATLEVERALAVVPSVRDAAVYGVAVPGCEGRAGMAALVVDGHFDRDALRTHLEAALPAYARPLFLRLCGELQVTETFKHKKQALIAEGFDPARVPDPLFFASATGEYVLLDAGVCARICAGEIRL